MLINMRKNKQYFVGVYWKARMATAEESAKSIYEILIELQAVSQVFNFWLEKVSENPDSAPEIKIEQSVVLTLIQDYFENNKHGYSFSAWNKERATISCLLGATSSYISNCFLVEFPCVSETLAIEEMNKIMSILRIKLNPDYGYANALEKLEIDHQNYPIGLFKIVSS